MIHTYECIEETRKSNDRIEEWLKQWPNHCTMCMGVGVLWLQLNKETNIVEISEEYPCEECLEKNKCPRCGNTFIAEDEKSCFFCYWDWNKGEGDSIPLPYECYCYETVAKEWLKQLTD